MEIIRCVDELKRLMSTLASDKIVCIEGCLGSGKSPLASAISLRPCRSVLRIDCFARRRTTEEKFPELVDVQRLNVSIRQAAPNLIVEGVLARKLIDSNVLAGAYFIYVKRLRAVGGLWHYGLSLDDERDGQFPYDEVWDYHHQYKPHECADVTFEFDDRSLDRVVRGGGHPVNSD